MSNDSNPSALGAVFDNVEQMIKAYREARDPREKRLFLSGSLRALEAINDRMTDAIHELTSATREEA